VKEKRVRTKLFQLWLHPREYQFLADYADKNMFTASETVRGWIHEVMKMEGHDISEPRNPKKLEGGK
jgi:hypothetical protein